MASNLIITRAAHLEEEDAFSYYEDIRSGLGEELLEELEKCYKKIENNPEYYSYLQYSKILRFIKVSRFPYIVIYMAHNSKTIVISIKNTYTKPKH